MNAQALRLLLQRISGDADIRVAAVATVGDEDNVKRLARRLHETRCIADRRGDGGLPLGFDAVEELLGGVCGEGARLRQNLAVGTVRRLAVAEGDEAEGKAIAVVHDGLSEPVARDVKLDRVPDLVAHALGGIEHEDDGGCPARHGGVLGGRDTGAKETGGQKQ